PRAAEQPRRGAKALVDITTDAKPGAVNKGLEQVARLLNLYGAAGLKAGDVKIAAVCHGEADKAVLSDAAYLARFKVAANPNLPLIRALKNAGVELFVCGQSLHDLGFKAEEVAEDVPVADSAMLVLVNKQADGYAYIPAREGELSSPKLWDSRGPGWRAGGGRRAEEVGDFARPDR